jgi:putative transposase
LRLARENSSWGYTRILGELKKLGITKICRSTVINILRENDLDPKTDPSKGTWADFLKAHAKTLWQCDFFSKHVVTAQGVRQCFILAFLHVQTRRVFLTPCTFKPDAKWMKEQAGAFLDHVKRQNLSADVVLLRDRDAKFENGFDAALKAGGCKVKKLSVRSPNTNAYVERFVQAIQQECLDKFIVFGREHLDHVASEYTQHYNTERPHQAMGNSLLTTPTLALADTATGDVVCTERLGGVLRHYFRPAA